jgi:hypothetical protein
MRKNDFMALRFSHPAAGFPTSDLRIFSFKICVRKNYQKVRDISFLRIDLRIFSVTICVKKRA